MVGFPTYTVTGRGGNFYIHGKECGVVVEFSCTISNNPMSRTRKKERKKCPWCGDPLLRNGLCKSCDPHKVDKHFKRKNKYKKQ
jgi:hypothetical protein